MNRDTRTGEAERSVEQGLGVPNIAQGWHGSAEGLGDVWVLAYGLLLTWYEIYCVPGLPRGHTFLTVILYASNYFPSLR